jgi:hypothetical protein
LFWSFRYAVGTSSSGTRGHFWDVAFLGVLDSFNDPGFKGITFLGQFFNAF